MSSAKLHTSGLLQQYYWRIFFCNDLIRTRLGQAMNLVGMLLRHRLPCRGARAASRERDASASHRAGEFV